MSKLTKRPKRPVLSRLTKTLVAGTVLVSGCGDNIVGVPSMDAGPADAMESPDSVGLDAFVGVPDVGSDVGSDAAFGVDAPGTDAPAPGVPPAEDAGPDGFVGI